MNAMGKIALVLVIVLVSLSAYLRLAHSGIGCADWPQCYGRIGPPAASQPDTGTDGAYLRLVEQANKPLAWAQPLHRLVASTLGLVVLFLTLLAFRSRTHRLLALALLGLTVYLAVLGIRSGGLHDPAVVMGNLSGGFAMLGLLGWLVFATGNPAAAASRRRVPGALIGLALVVLCAQILLGGLTSANFAATACLSLPDCHGEWLPGRELATSLDLSRQHEVTSDGRVTGGRERVAIHLAHRLGALLTLLVVLATGVVAWRAGLNGAAATIGVLVLLEFAVGAASVATDLPIGLAVAHNWLAGLLLLSLVWLAANNPRESGFTDNPR